MNLPFDLSTNSPFGLSLSKATVASTSSARTAFVTGQFHSTPRTSSLSRQRGFVLVMTLIILVIMVLSAQGLMMMMRGGVTTAGNVAFRQAAVRVADVGAEAAFQTINTATSNVTTGATALTTTSLTTAGMAGYYAIYNEAAASCRSTTAVCPGAIPGDTASFCPQVYNFADIGDNCSQEIDDSANSGYKLYYVIHRMASNYGACPGAGCSGPAVATTCPPGSSQDPSSPNYCNLSASGNSGATAITHVYYRVTVKVMGPRHNSRYIQTFVY